MKKGFTLIEIVLVMVLISILSIGVTIGYNYYVTNAKDMTVQVQMNHINSTISYFKETKGRLPNISEINELLNGDYEFHIADAIISESNGALYLAIRADSDKLSKYNHPFSISIISLYNNEFGTKQNGDALNVTDLSNQLLKSDVDRIEMLIIDNVPSGVEEIIWLN